MSDQSVEVPRYVDEPPILLMWSADEIGTFILIFVAGFILEQIIISLFVAYFSMRAMGRIKNQRPRGFASHLMYWVGVMPTKARTMPNTYIKEFRE